MTDEFRVMAGDGWKRRRPINRCFNESMNWSTWSIGCWLLKPKARRNRGGYGLCKSNWINVGISFVSDALYEPSDRMPTRRRSDLRRSSKSTNNETSDRKPVG